VVYTGRAERFGLVLEHEREAGGLWHVYLRGVEDEDGDVALHAGTFHVPSDRLALDLTDPTARAHAAWWAWPRWETLYPVMRAYTLPQVEQLGDERRLLLSAERGSALPDADIARLRDLCLRLAEVTRG
jgi:hypothetical protein